MIAPFDVIPSPGQPGDDPESTLQADGAVREINAGRRDIAEGRSFSNDDINRWLQQCADAIDRPRP